MPKVLDPFRFLLIAVAGWMNHHQLQMIEYLREENRVLRNTNFSGARLPPLEFKAVPTGVRGRLRQAHF